MKKMNLRIEDIKLESFIVPGSGQSGTVVAAEASLQKTCGYTCPTFATCCGDCTDFC
jgi:hypothetical protein